MVETWRKIEHTEFRPIRRMEFISLSERYNGVWYLLMFGRRRLTIHKALVV